MAESFVEVKDLAKIFQMGPIQVRALDGVDLNIQAHTFTLVMGPSGSGKSTLLYLLGGLDRPTRGQIRVAGQSVDSLDENQLAFYRRNTVGFIFQAFNLIPSLSALENVAYPLRFNGVNRRQRTQRARDLLAQVGLSDRAHHRPTELSGGQQQRVAIARALINRPQLILADEPTGNLDTASGDSIMRLLSELHMSGTTVLVVSHDTRMIHYASQVINILDGKILVDAAPASIGD